MQIIITMCRKYLFAVSVVFVLLLVSFIIALFLTRIESNEVSIASKNLEHMTKSNAKAVTFVLDTFYETLETTALAMAQYENIETQRVSEFLKNIAEKNGFASLSVDYGENNTETGVYLSGVYFEKTSKYFISDISYSEADGKAYIYMSVPLFNGGAAKEAYLKLTLATDYLNQIFNLTFFNVESHYVLIDRNGNFLTADNLKKPLLGRDSFFDFIDAAKYKKGFSAEDIKKVFSKGVTTHTQFSYDKNEWYAFFTPIEVNNWVLTTIVERSVVLKQRNINATYAISLTISLLLISLAIFGHFYLEVRRRRDIAELDDKCFRTLSEQMGKTIFEWDFSKNKITSMTNFKLLFGREAVTKSSSEQAIFAGVIHEDDILTFSKMFENIIAGNNVSNIRFRIKNDVGQFLWSSVSGIVIKDKKGRPYRAIGCLENINEQILREEELKNKAEIDQLTGLYNKATTEFLIRKTLQGFNRRDDNHALLIIDIDNFKVVNDKLGHLFGDVVLALLAGLLKPLFRSDDIIGRIGGDEFFVLLKNYTSENTIYTKANEICKLFERTFSENDITCNVSASIGIALCPLHGTEFDTLYKSADTALYITKENGKNGFTIYDGVSRADYKSERTAIDSQNVSKDILFKDDSFNYFLRHMFASSNPFASAKSVLQLIAVHYKFSASFIYQLNAEGNAFVLDYEYIVNDSASSINSLKVVPLETFKDIYNIFKENGEIILENMDDISQDYKKLLSSAEINSLYLLALKTNSEPTGFIGFASFSSCYSVESRTLNNLRTVCDLLSAFLNKQQEIETAQKSLNSFVSLIDNLDRFVYVVDKESFTLLFVNKKTKLFAPNAIPNKICFEVLKNNQTPCSYCPLLGLTDGMTENCILTNEKNTDYTINATWIDWLNGHRVCLIDCLDFNLFCNNRQPLIE